MGMPNKALNDMIEAVGFEKGMPEDVVREAMETAIAGLARKEQKAPEGEFRAVIDSSGGIRVFRLWRVCSEVTQPDAERLAENGEADGDTVETEIDVPAWTRTGLQVVKQILAQKLKQGLRDVVAQEWGGRVGSSVTGLVKKIEKDRIFVDIGGGTEGVIEGRDRIPGEHLRPGQRVRSWIKNVDVENKGAVVQLSRADTELLRELVEIEVPEAGMGQIRIRAVAREPGSRAKVIVEGFSHGRSSPAAICAGMRGARAQAISGELSGERIDFIEWSDNSAELILNALVPAEVTSIILDEAEKRATVGIEEDKLARAIGARGQNVRLASRATGWKIDVMSNDDMAKKRHDEDEAASEELKELLDIDDELAGVLMMEGFRSVEDIGLSAVVELYAIDGFDTDMADILHERAREAIELKRMIISAAAGREPVLSDLNGVDDDALAILNEQGIASMADLADLATDEVVWPDNDDRIGAWIIQAREAVGMI